MYVIAHYINKGHSLEEMVNLSPSGLLFYKASLMLEAEQWEEATNHRN